MHTGLVIGHRLYLSKSQNSFIKLPNDCQICTLCNSCLYVNNRGSHPVEILWSCRMVSTLLKQSDREDSRCLSHTDVRKLGSSP